MGEQSDIIIGMAIIIAGLMLTIFVMHEMDSTCSAENADYREQIQQLQQDATNAAARAALAEKQAENAVSNIPVKSEQIMDTKVSSNCTQAIQWAAQQAAGLTS
jgi:DUF917 family protein